VAAESWATSKTARNTMLANRSRDTGPELALRRELHRRGFRFRVCARPIKEVRRTADILFTRQRLAVFVDGCFWHGCPDHYTAPVKNASFWSDKVERNRARDAQTDQLLRAAGWTVLRLWEHVSLTQGADLVARLHATLTALK
jgi:DNA mismatch endonuclease (patch repair protein)